MEASLHASLHAGGTKPESARLVLGSVRPHVQDELVKEQIHEA